MKNYFLPHNKLQTLIDTLIKAGYQCQGPQARDGTIIYAELTQSEQLPWGVIDHQNPGEYRLEKTKKHKAFLFANGPQAIKPNLFKAKEQLWSVVRDESGTLQFKSCTPEIKPLALFGIRACDLAALKIQDKIFLQDKYVDQYYQKQREQLFIIAANCTRSGNNCFCASTGDGPQASPGYDINMTEIDHGFVLHAGSEAGTKIIAKLQLDDAKTKQTEVAKSLVTQAGAAQTKKLPSGNLRDILFNNLDHPRWDEVADRCLSCANCTLVCPTCFCHDEKDEMNLAGNSSIHSREWDSCFTQDHSYVAGQVLREDTKSRYKQWLTHKLGSWWDQFDSSGCIGCGRCITWCPVGIDITEEVQAICE